MHWKCYRHLEFRNLLGKNIDDRFEKLQHNWADISWGNTETSHARKWEIIRGSTILNKQRMCVQKVLEFLCWLWIPIFIIKQTRYTNFSDVFWNKILHVSNSSSVHHQEIFTVHTVMVYVIQVCRQLASRIRMKLQFHSDPARKLSTNLCDIYHYCVYSEKLLMMGRGTVRNM
jgi:hypothetical protein